METSVLRSDGADGVAGPLATAGPRLSGETVEELNRAFADAPPHDTLRWAIECFGERLAFVTSFQAEGMALLDMAWRINPTIRVVTVDSGRLPGETHELIDRVRERYGIAVEVYAPDANALESFVSAEGTNSFYRSVTLRLRCCDIRKVAPLRRALSGYDAWVTGRRRDHTTTRRSIATVEVDDVHGGLIKLNPLAGWTAEQVWDYIRERDLPYNALYDQGYTSIGCAPCTRPTRPGEDPRSGRWWWEGVTPKECGIHLTLSPTGAGQRPEQPHATRGAGAST
jgi:thioredoxin-dependent adenylylsulfate APS reductase